MQRKTGISLLLGAVGVVAAFLWIEASRMGLTSAGAQLNEQLRLARLDGLPLKPEDLQPAKAPDDQNASWFLMKAYAQMHELKPSPATVLDSWQNPTSAFPKTQEEVQEALSELAPALATAEQASKMPYLDMAWRWDAGPDVQFDGLAEVRQLGDCFVARARFERERSNSEQAIQSLLAASRLSRLLSNLPISIAWIIEIMLSRRVTDEAANLLRQEPNPAVIKGVRLVLSTLGSMPNLRFFERGDFLLLNLTVPTLGRPRPQDQASGYVPMNQQKWRLLRYSSVSDLNQANAIRLFRKEYDSLPTNLASIPSSMEEIRLADAELNSMAGFGYLLTKEFVRPHAQMVDTCLDFLARRRVLEAGMEILERRAADGTFPATWTKVGSDGIDPFTNRPLMYRLTPEGFVIYSLDRDRKDDGGRPYWISAKGERRSDISFEYPTLTVRPITVRQRRGNMRSMGQLPATAGH